MMFIPGKTVITDRYENAPALRRGIFLRRIMKTIYPEVIFIP